MIFLDANVFLRHLAAPTTPADVRRGALARALFDDIRQGRQLVTTTEVVLHEVCYILTSSRHHGHPATGVAADMMEVIQYAGFRFLPGEREIYLRAFELWIAQPRLGFADSVIAARCEATGHDLATFDRHFDAIPTLTRWQWEPPTA